MSCKIIVDSFNDPTYLHGSVICYIPKTIKIREVRCILKGKEYTSFQQGEYAFYGKNIFLLREVVLYNRDTIEAGTYRFPFEFRLPPDLPNSLQMKHGCIKYTLKAYVDIPLSFDYIEKIGVLFSHPVDLNVQHGILLGNITYEWEEKMNWISCFACCDNGLSTMRCTLQEKNAYVSGEVLNMFVDVKNISKTNMQRLDVTLTRITTFKVHGGNCVTQKRFLAFQTYDGVSSNTQRSYSIDYRIPQSIVPNNFFWCKLIEEVFRLRVVGVYPSCYDDLIVDFYLVIGQIPLNNLAEDEETTRTN
ncbi:unnamed protein product [Psylliodes chrysocephalus]|uniref:Arrestin C-terminal-like domain-containing protein n=1 Tax=Psylliodes chrysocephalus TaxID=3402493 RepID=A0A9P0GJW3_9CUCU|nr:unnamed protein product [Psylliodes chrysocephala]